MPPRCFAAQYAYYLQYHWITLLGRPLASVLALALAVLRAAAVSLADLGATSGLHPALRGAAVSL